MGLKKTAAALLVAVKLATFGGVGAGIFTGLTACDTPTNQVEQSQYDKDGYDKEGYNAAGWDREGYNKAGYNASGYNRDGYDKNGYDVSGYDKNGYDANGYDKDGFNVNGYNADGYDKDGYDADGYDANGHDKDGNEKGGQGQEDEYDEDGYDKNGYDRSGYDRDGYNASGYDQNGYNRDGYDSDGFDASGYDRNGDGREGTPEPKIIPSYPTSSYLTVNDINFDNILIQGVILQNLTPYANNIGGNQRQASVSSKWLDWLCQMQVQSDNLKSGYSAVATAYPDLHGIQGAIDGETAIHNAIEGTTNITPYLNSASNTIDGILSGIIPDRADFDKYLDAYQKGHFYDQKKRNDSGSKTDAQAAYTAALDALTQGDFNSSGDISTDLSAIQAAMLEQINAAMGVDGIEEEGNRAIISGLNNDLLKTIKNEREAAAVVSDLGNTVLNYQNKLPGGYTFSYLRDTLGVVNEYAVAPQSAGKAAHLADASFNADLLKLLKPYINVKDEKSGIETA
jgi:hypothetical protein